MLQPHRTLAICGPTASGKSALSIELARGLGGEIINIDSVQVYRELNIGSAKLPESERGSIPHHVLDIFSPQQTGNVADFRNAALAAIDDVSSRGRLPLLVGGSGLYVTALLHGLAEMPSTPPDVRAAVAMLSSEEQYAELLRADPATAARLNPRDSQRVSRALEVYRLTGVPLSSLIERHKFASVDVVSLVIVLCRRRDELYLRIDERARQMVDNGLVDETRDLLSRFGRVPIMDTLGYRQACDFLEGRLAEKDLVAEIALHTRRFAKRQMTYWRNEPAKRGWAIRPSVDEAACEVQGVAQLSGRAKQNVKGFRAFDWTCEELRDRVVSRLAAGLQQTEVWYVSPLR